MFSGTRTLPPHPVGGEITGRYFQAKVPERTEGDLCLGVGAFTLPPQWPGLMWDYRQLEVLLMFHRWHERERERAGEREGAPRRYNDRKRSHLWQKLTR